MSAIRGPLLLRTWRGDAKKAAAARLFGVSRQAYQKWEDGEVTPDPIAWFHIDEITAGAVPWDSWSPNESVIAMVRATVRRDRTDGNEGRAA